MSEFFKNLIRTKIVGMGAVVECAGQSVLVQITSYRPATPNRGFVQGDPSEVGFVVLNRETGEPCNPTVNEEDLYDCVCEMMDAEWERVLGEAIGTASDEEQAIGAADPDDEEVA